MLISQAELNEIRMEVEWLDHLPNGFYLYRGDDFNVTVAAQGPFDWTRLAEQVRAETGVAPPSSLAMRALARWFERRQTIDASMHQRMR